MSLYCQNRLGERGRRGLLAAGPIRSETASRATRPCRSHKTGRRRIHVTMSIEPEGLRFPQPPKSPFLAPSLWLSPEEAVDAQLAALKNNNSPYVDHGIEILYRFAGFDPWERSTYFGRSLDLGQFERFRRVFSTQCFAALPNHTESTILSTLEVDEYVWKARVLVKNGYRKEEAVYEFTMNRRFGGKYDGVWFCTSLVCDGCDDKHLYGVI